MKLRRINSLTVFLVLFALAVVAGITYFYGPLDPVPRLHASATNPDGSLAVKVYKERLTLLPASGVRVVAKVYNREGETMYERRVEGIRRREIRRHLHISR